MAHDIFISHSSKDKAVADAACACLESRGLRCWIAPRDIVAGAEWGASIIDGIQGSKAMVLILSSHSNISPQVLREIERAVSRGIPVLPFQIEDVVLSRSLEYLLSSAHWLDAHDGDLARCASDVAALISNPTASICTGDSRARHNVSRDGSADPTTSDYDVFLSYRRESGSPTVRLLQATLERHGLRVFLDVDDLRPGHFDESLLCRIRETRNFLLVLSPGCLDRCGSPQDWLRREIAEAIRTERTIVPVMMPGFVFPSQKSLPEDIRALNTHHGVNYSHEFFDAMIKKVIEFFSPSDQSPRRDTTAEHPSKKGSGVASQSSTAVSRVLCPHCWTHFAPEESMWISSDHPSLLGDPKLGPDAPHRFRPRSLDLQGIVLDERGGLAQGLACPHCHLEVPRDLYDYRPFIVSLMGVPNAGRSFLIPAMTWFLRAQMRDRFEVNVEDSDLRLNTWLRDYENTLFMNPDRESLVVLSKTPFDGQDFYDEVVIDGEVVLFPRPCVFRMQPSPDHPAWPQMAEVSRVLCMYDNPGEAFFPQATSRESRCINHLEHCDLTLFCFDPTQHPRFRERAKAVSKDPQWMRQNYGAVPQHVVLQNASARLRHLRRLSPQDRFGGPLVVVVTKLDAWVNLIPEDVRNPLLAADYTPRSTVDSQRCVLRVDLVQQLSKTIRVLLRTLAPEIVSAAESFSTNVTYVPVSATGCIMREVPGVPWLGVRPRNINPKWAELPLLYGMAQAKVPLVQTVGGDATPGRM